MPGYIHVMAAIYASIIDINVTSNRLIILWNSLSCFVSSKIGYLCREKPKAEISYLLLHSFKSLNNT